MQTFLPIGGFFMYKNSRFFMFMRIFNLKAQRFHSPKSQNRAPDFAYFSQISCILEAFANFVENPMKKWYNEVGSVLRPEKTGGESRASSIFLIFL